LIVETVVEFCSMMSNMRLSWLSSASGRDAKTISTTSETAGNPTSTSRSALHSWCSCCNVDNNFRDFEYAARIVNFFWKSGSAKEEAKCIIIALACFITEDAYAMPFFFAKMSQIIIQPPSASIRVMLANGAVRSDVSGPTQILLAVVTNAASSFFTKSTTIV
jgi:hypothetical protein